MEALARHELRTAPGYGLVVAAMIGLGAIAAGLLVFEVDLLVRGSFGGRELVLVVLTVLMAILPVAWYAGTAAYRIGGRRGELRFFADRLEVPAAGGRASLSLSRDRLRVVAQPQVVRVLVFGVPAGDVDRGRVLVLSDGASRRRLSSKTLADESWLDGLEEDLRRFIAGEAPLGPRRAAAVEAAAAEAAAEIAVGGAAARSEYEARLDRELSELD